MTVFLQPYSVGKRALRLCFVAALTGLATLAAAGPASTQAALESTDSLRSQLASRLDSLEMVKQDKKRRGESLDELERESQVIKDSLVELRRAVERKSPAASIAPIASAADSARPLLPDKGILKLVRQVLKPASIIDWAIIGIGAIAVLSGAFLILSLAFASGRKKRRAGRAVGQQKTFGGYTATGRPSAAPAESPEREKSSRPVPSAPVPDDDELDHLESTPDEDLNLLRRRVRQEPSHDQPADPPLGLGAADPARPSTVPSDVRRQVIDAAAEGSDLAEISRRFHLSADHVALILKVAAKKR